MPEARPGMMHHVTATKAVNHGAPCVEENIVGVAVKQAAAPAGTGLGATAVTQIAIGEKFAMIIKGRVLVANLVSIARGDAVYITAATNALTKTGPAAGTTTYKFGRCVEVAGDRGVPTGQCRIDLDTKDSFV